MGLSIKNLVLANLLVGQNILIWVSIFNKDFFKGLFWYGIYTILCGCYGVAHYINKMDENKELEDTIKSSSFALFSLRVIILDTLWTFASI